MSLMLDDSPFHHCRLCTKAYSSEKSLNKHLRKKHHAHSLVGRASPSVNLADSASSDDHHRMMSAAKGDILTLTVPVACGGSGSRASLLDDVVIICPECSGTIKSKKGVAKHYMCFHNGVYAAWKSGWFGRSVRLMDLTKEMIRDFHASEEAVGVAATDDLVKDRAPPPTPIECTDEPSIAGMVLDSVDEAEDDSTNLSGAASDLLRSQTKTIQTPEPSRKASNSVGLPQQRQAKRSKLKTQIATTAPFFISKDGNMKFNTNENPLDINCPFCITHKTTIKGLAKHCVNHHLSEYTSWKNGKFGSVQLRYVRPDPVTISQTLNKFEQLEKQPNEIAVEEIRAVDNEPSLDNEDVEVDESEAETPTPPTPPPSVRSPSVEAVGSGNNASGGAANAAAFAAAAAAASLSICDDDKQATPCPFCGELIFSKGMGKHCIYFHHEQYQEWKAGKFGSVALRFVPNQIGSNGDVKELSERALKRREARKKNGISITVPLMETTSTSPGSGAAGVAGAPAEATTPDTSSSNVTMRIKPSVFSGEVYRCGECGRVFDKSSSLSQHLRIHKYGPSMSKQPQAAGEPAEDSTNYCDEEDEDDAVVFVCHCCEAAFDFTDELKRHLVERHQATDEPLPPADDESDDGESDRSVRFLCHLCHAQHSSRRNLVLHIQAHRTADSHPNAAGTAPREPGELSPEASPSSSSSSVSMFASQDRPDRHFCSVCQSCFPSARSLAQHNRVHKFSPGMTKSSTGSGNVVSLDDDGNESADGSEEELSREGRLQISDTGSWTLAASSRAGCPKCGKLFADKYFLRNHLGRCFAEALADGELEMGDLASMAGVPLDGPNSHAAYQAVQQQASPAASYNCSDCGRSFSSTANLVKHSVVHSNDSVSCKLCHREFRMPCHLARHFCEAQKQQQHPNSVEPLPPPAQAASSAANINHRCDLCSRAFQYADNLTVHRRFCQQHGTASPSSRSDFELQQNEESDDNPSGQMLLLDCEDEEHECSMCNETFADKASLDSHTAVCSLNRFAQQQVKQQQMLPPAPPPLPPPQQQKSSTARAFIGQTGPTDARVQQQLAPPPARASNQPERERVPCPNCGKTYCRKDVLEAHLRTSCRGVKHAGGVSASPAAKVPRLDLKQHPLLAFPCDICPSQFSSSLGLVVHRSKCHPQFYGPSHRRAAAAAAAAAAAVTSSSTAAAPAVAATAAPAASIASTADQGPLLSLPNRCPQCPRAFLNAGRLRDHLASAHSDRDHAASGGVGNDNNDQEGEADVAGRLVLDDAAAADDKDESSSSLSPPQPAEAQSENQLDGSIVNFDAFERDESQYEVIDDAEYADADAYLCSECDGFYPTFDLLNRHLKEAHEIDSVTPEPPGAKQASPVQNEHTPAYQVVQQLTPAVPAAALPTGARKRKSAPVSIN